MINLLPSNPQLSRHSKGPEPGLSSFVGRRDKWCCLATNLLHRPTHQGTSPWSRWRFSPFRAPVWCALSSRFSPPHNQRKDGQYWGRSWRHISGGSQQWVFSVKSPEIRVPDYVLHELMPSPSCNLWIQTSQTNDNFSYITMGRLWISTFVSRALEEQAEIRSTTIWLHVQLGQIWLKNTAASVLRQEPENKMTLSTWMMLKRSLRSIALASSPQGRLFVLDFSVRTFTVYWGSWRSLLEKLQKLIQMGRFEFPCAVGRAHWKSKNEMISISVTANQYR